MSALASKWLTRLEQFTPLADEDRRLLEDIAEKTHQVFASDLRKVGDPIERFHVVLEGIVCQYQILPDGRRQILGYLFAGDMCDPRELLLTHADYSMCVFMPSTIATISATSLQKIGRKANIADAFERYSRMRQAVTRQWQMNVGFRTAIERLSHLVCEIHASLSIVGLTHGHSFELPLTQTDLGDTLALSSVHVNRTLMELRRLGVMNFQNRQIVIHDYPALCEAAGFDGSYLRIPGAIPATAS